ncbi:hypothetical protein N7520_001598 [Penicillium odoratum]|uniref:uncharacterized protein n=1 Tax=Penicillium odoratum TaxID=1167516 RepID=UPI0025475E36|nr:uncharacterized protein N7520_001598 [Penicillium odoratum]KAJ5778352.1 hypothetical protein N7520_001598 [Penicillium odoratum]
MVLRHFTSHRDVVQDEAVDTPHAYLTAVGSETEQSEPRPAPRPSPLPTSSITDPKAHHAGCHPAGRGSSDSTRTTTKRSQQTEQGTFSISRNSILQVQFASSTKSKHL